MNFKKIVSAFSALAISVSAFAALAVTANAAEGDTVTTYYVGSANSAETFDNYTGSVFVTDASNANIYSKATTIAAGGTLPELGGTITTATEGTIVSGEYPVYVSGKVWKVQSRGNSGRSDTYSLADSAISKGTVHISTDIAFDWSEGVMKAKEFSVKDSDNADVLKISYTPGGKDKSGNLIYGSLSINDTTVLDKKLPFRDVTPVGFHIEATIDLDEHKAEATIDYVDATNLTRTTETVSNLTFSVSNVKSIYMFTGGISKQNHGISIDNTKIYNTYVDDGKASYTVTTHYQDTEGNTIAPDRTDTVTDGETFTPKYEATISNTKTGKKYTYKSGGDSFVVSENATTATIVYDVEDLPQYTVTVKATGDGVDETLATGTVYAGDEFTYSFSKYLTDENGKVTAYTDETTFTKTVTPTETTTIDIPFTAYTGDAWFVENSLGSTGYSHSTLSGGSASRGASSATKIFTVTESGIYKIATRAFSNNTNAERTYKIAKNDASVDANILANVSLASKSINYVLTTVTENISLDANDVIYIVPSDTQVCLDYTLLEKTAELTYDITATQPENGALTVSPTTAAEGETVTVTATADTGYEVKSVSATAGGTEIAVTKVTDGTYTFTMPASAVTVSAVIEAIPTTPDPSATFETISESEKVGNIYNVGFLSTIKALENNTDWTVKDAGFTFANINDESVSSGQVSVKPTDALKLDDAFSYIFQNIPDSYTGFGIFAVPYIVFAKEGSDNVTVQGEAVNGSNDAFGTTDAASDNTAE